LSAYYLHGFQLLTIIHKSNVLSVTDGLFRESVRAVPTLSGIDGKFDDITIEEQLVDSAVYRCVERPSIFISKLTVNVQVIP
jgi:homoisocitrate dehydrogenase